MWEEAPISEKPRKETRYLLSWIDEIVLTDDRNQRADACLKAAEKLAPALKAYRTTPQGAPWHGEGPTVDFHIRRFLAGVMAIEEGASLLEIEELAREKTIRAEIRELEEIIREQAGSFLTYALVHDIGKIDTLSFESSKGSLGAREGFFGHKYQLTPVADEASKQHYLKLFRAFTAKKTASMTELTAAFFDEYEIETHFFKHEKIGASEQYADTRASIASLYRVGPDDLAKIQFVVKNHIDAILFFRDQPNPAKYLLLVDRVNRAGFDADDVLDLLVAAIFLDVAIGSLAYQNGQFVPDLKPILNMLKSEHLAAPERRRRKEEAQDLVQRRAKKKALTQAGLLGEGAFAQFDVPFGRERKTFTETIRAALEDPGLTIDFGPHTDEIRRRIETARGLLTQGLRP